MNFLHLLFSFSGRIGRLPFWIGTIIVIAFQIALEWAFGIPLIDDPGDQRLRAIAFVIGLITLYPSAAIAVKRLHDRDQQGRLVWLLLAAFFVALVGDLFGYFDSPEQMSVAGWLALAFAGVIGLAFLIDLGFTRGTSGPNQYGPAPS